MTEGNNNDQSGLRSLDRPWLILAALFCVTAALGLPFLWASRSFRTPAKVWISILVCAYTVLILWLCWQVMQWSWGRIAPYV